VKKQRQSAEPGLWTYRALVKHRQHGRHHAPGTQPPLAQAHLCATTWCGEGCRATDEESAWSCGGGGCDVTPNAVSVLQPTSSTPRRRRASAGARRGVGGGGVAGSMGHCRGWQRGCSLAGSCGANTDLVDAARDAAPARTPTGIPAGTMPTRRAQARRRRRWGGEEGVEWVEAATDCGSGAWGQHWGKEEEGGEEGLLRRLRLQCGVGRAGRRKSGIRI
jgi:hypothetical protein